MIPDMTTAVHLDMTKVVNLDTTIGMNLDMTVNLDMTIDMNPDADQNRKRDTVPGLNQKWMTGTRSMNRSLGEGEGSENRGFRS